MPWPCVRPSVCLSQTCVLSKLLNGLSCFSVEAVFSQEIPISPKYGYIRRELCLKLWTWKISPRHADRRKFCQRSLQAAEAIGPGGLRPVHFWPLCAAAISDPPTFEPPFKHAMVQFYIAIAYYNVLTSTGIASGTARQHGCTNIFFTRSARELFHCTVKIVVGP